MDGSQMTMESTLIQVRKIFHSIDTIRILDSISFDVPSGEIITIVGPSGSGKSTLLRTLNRLIGIDSGRILFHGSPIDAIPPRELRQHIGMVFQVPIPFPGTVRENILTGPSLSCDTTGTCSGDEKDPRSTRDSDIDVDSILGAVGLPPTYADRIADTLSVGEQQRVCIARALANNPEVLLMDEPTSSLDPESTRRIESLITRLNREQGLTFVVITHDMDQARRIGTTTLLLEAGSISENLPTSEFFTIPRPGFRTTCCHDHGEGGDDHAHDTIPPDAHVQKNDGGSEE